MVYEPLATVADMEARGVTVDPEELTVVETYLRVGSTIVRDAAGTPISETTSTVALEGTRDSRLHLPSRPVTEVSSVLMDGDPVTDFRLLSGALWRSAGWQGVGPSEVTVTFTHGYATVPADVVDIVCRLAATALVSYRSGDSGSNLADRPVVSERIGDYSATYAYANNYSEIEIPQYHRDRLAARFGGGPAVVVKSR